MGYRIQYEPELSRYYPVKIKNHLRKKKLLYSCAFVFILFVLAVPVCRNFLWELLIPGNAKTTTEAFSQMVCRIQDGSAISEAVTLFCKEILTYA